MKKKTLTTLVGAITIMMPAHAQLVINEVMQSNIDCIMDDTNEFPDSWVELYNSGNAAINLGDYRLGLSDDATQAYALPQKSIAAGGYALIYCDKAAKGLHTDFRLESGKGGSVYLFQGTTIADKIEKMKKQPAPNIAYGRKTDGTDKWGYMATATPGAKNCGETCKDILGSPLFSTPGRILESQTAISLTLSLPDDAPAGTLIRYTTDGSEPTDQSPQYQQPISISSTQVVRAKLFCQGYLSPRSATASYIFHGRKLTLPVISIVSDSKYFYDSKKGILVSGNYSSKRNYEYDWRRPINLEYFTQAESQSQLNQLCETRVMGGASRDHALKSLAIYANKRFGEKRFKYEFFPEQRPGVTDFKSLALRNAGNDFDYLYMRDAVIQRSMAEHADLDWQAWSPAIVYINGTYKGILNIRERSNEDNIYTHYDGLEDIDMIENNNELKAGNWDNFNQFKAFYAEHGHTMAEYEKWMDCEEYINLMAMNLFYNNQDFPGNNIVTWRPRAEGGRWRWVAKDTDFGLGLYDVSAEYKTFEWINNPDYDSNHAWANKYEHTRLFRRLMEDKDFQREFIDRSAIYLGDFLTEQRIRELWDGMYAQIKTEYPNHRAVYNKWWPDYATELSKAQKWLHDRIPSYYQQLADYYKLGAPVSLTINQDKSAEELSKLQISFNGVKLSQANFDGKFFGGREITLTGESTEAGKEVVQWQIATHNGSALFTQIISGNTCHLTMPQATKVEISATLGSSTGIKDLTTSSDASSWTWSLEDTHLQLRHLPLSTPIYIYSMQGGVIYQSKSTSSSVTIPLSPGAYILKVGGKAVKIISY